MLNNIASRLFAAFMVLAALLPMLMSLVSAAPPTALSARAPSYVPKTSLLSLNLNLGITLSTDTCEKIESSKKPVSLGRSEYTIYDWYCVETCIYLHQVKTTEEFVLRFHEEGICKGNEFSIDVQEVIKVQTVFNNGCAVVTEQAEILVDIKALGFEEIVKICIAAKIEIHDGITTKSQILAHIGITDYSD